MSVQTPECLAPGNTRTPDVILYGWRPTDVPLPRPNGGGWVVTGWDLDGNTSYGRKATEAEWLQRVGATP